MVVQDGFKQFEIAPAFPPQLLFAFQLQPRSVTPQRIFLASLAASGRLV